MKERVNERTESGKDNLRGESQEGEKRKKERESEQVNERKMWRNESKKEKCTEMK